MRNVVDQSSGHRDPAKLIRVTPCTAPSRAGLLSPLPVPTETLWAALHIRPLVSFWGGRSAKGRAVSILTLPDSHPSLSPSGAQRAQDADSLPGRQVPRAGCLISAPTAKALNEPQAAPPYGAPNPDTHLNISDRPHTAPRVPAPQHTPCPLPQGPSGTWVTRGSSTPADLPWGCSSSPRRVRAGPAVCSQGLATARASSGTPADRVPVIPLALPHASFLPPPATGGFSPSLELAGLGPIWDFCTCCPQPKRLSYLPQPPSPSPLLFLGWLLSINQCLL